jgi:hypothetical protein
MTAPWKALRKRKRTQVPDAYFALAVEFRRVSTGRSVDERSAILKEMLDEQDGLNSADDESFVDVEELVRLLSLADEGVDLCPANAVMGGIVGQVSFLCVYVSLYLCISVSLYLRIYVSMYLCI